ncbi:MAG: rhomboid family intramembrane serine protease [Myxococcales bacterium]|nr:rhomboid family intramembrane serine protease [Myxococcales bacterium]
MRALAQYKEESLARRLGAVLVVEGVRNRVEPTRDGLFTVWVEEETQVPKGREIHARFELDPDHPDYRAAEREARSIERAERKENRRHSQRVRRTEATVRRIQRTNEGAGLVTLGALAIMGGVYIAVYVFGRNDLFELLLYSPRPGLAATLGYGPLEAVGGQYWRLISPVFLHADPRGGFGILHILFNAYMLKEFGSILERVHGPWWFAGLFVAFAVSSNAVAYLWDGPLFIGASGVNYALFGYLWVRGRFDPTFPVSLHPQTILILVVWLFLGFGMQGIANGAHAGGILSGAVWGFLSSGYLRRRL